MVFFLPAKKHLQVFNPGKHDDEGGADNADDEHAFENSHQYSDDDQTHKQTMLFETRQVDQCCAEQRVNSAKPFTTRDTKAHEGHP